MVLDVDEVFKALADPTRRGLLDELFREDGRSWGYWNALRLLTFLNGGRAGM